MSMQAERPPDIVRCGRRITEQEIEAARETARICGGLSRRELGETICEHWGWVTASGSLKLTACLKVLEELERRGDLKLPPKKIKPSTERVRGARHTRRTEPPGEKLIGKLSEVSPVELQVVAGREPTKRWRPSLILRTTRGPAGACPKRSFRPGVFSVRCSAFSKSARHSA